MIVRETASSNPTLNKTLETTSTMPSRIHLFNWNCIEKNRDKTINQEQISAKKLDQQPKKWRKMKENSQKRKKNKQKIITAIL